MKKGFVIHKIAGLIKVEKKLFRTAEAHLLYGGGSWQMGVPRSLHRADLQPNRDHTQGRRLSIRTIYADFCKILFSNNAITLKY